MTPFCRKKNVAFAIGWFQIVIGMKLYYKILAWAVLAVCALQMLLVVASWLVTAANPELYMRSMLGGEGIRWFFGRFTENLESPLLVWIILGSIALGTLRKSGIATAMRKNAAKDYRTRMALHVAVCELAAAFCLILLLTILPHGILLSAVGKLFPSSFSTGFFPTLAFVACMVALTYGFMTGQFSTVHDAFEAMTEGVMLAAPLVVTYVFAAEFYHSLMFVFMV